uniref:Thyroxine-binding globulin n=1 Tax=Monopterus albus TaxID=43700 RepID=A0A3Q3Q1E6_MONAL|nr:alpha-1-antitrypsin homolog [Monopterus albus]XP_020446224.1 alpha-1-antitrypsin homolog [Monopterus albus]XP_020446312.1 alpha-1-antitrypsin homolog [Monopterus albus]
MMRTALGIWILTAVVCIGRGHHHIGHVVKDHSHQDTALESSTNTASLVRSANKEFAFRLYRKLAPIADSEGKNTFCSPSSVSIALAALSVGAREETHRQLFSGLGFNGSLLTQADVNQAFHALLLKENRLSGDISEGAAVFVANHFKPEPAFLDTLKQSYLAEGFNVDFTNPTDSADTINNYVSEKTHGKIDKLVENLNPATIMYLISYIYYKGKWESPFDPQRTREDTFIVDENTKVPVQMMNREGQFDVYNDRDINTTVLHLPFNSSFSMLLMLPKDMATLENNLGSTYITKWLKWKRSSKYDVFIPKISIKTSYILNDVLAEMGMIDMFGQNADLSGISPGRNLAVSEVVHQATLDLDEAGATATAVTGIGIVPLSIQFTPVLKFNQPFMAAIIDRDTEDILFIGKIVNPNK